jgi:hypothetical protein
MTTDALRGESIVAAPRSTEPAPSRAPTPRALLIEDLERRIGAIEAADESEVGRFTAWDWVVCVVGAGLAPAFALWWFAP